MCELRLAVLSFKARLRPFTTPYFLIRYLRYYGPGDYPFVTFLALPFRCGPSPVTAKRRAVRLYRYDCLNAILRTLLYSASLHFCGTFPTYSMTAITSSPITTHQNCVR